MLRGSELGSDGFAGSHVAALCQLSWCTLDSENGTGEGTLNEKFWLGTEWKNEPAAPETISTSRFLLGVARGEPMDAPTSLAAMPFIVASTRLDATF